MPPCRNRAGSWERFQSPSTSGPQPLKMGVSRIYAKAVRCVCSALLGAFFTLPNGSCEIGKRWGAESQPIPSNRADQRDLFDEVTPVADVDQSKSDICVRADMNLRAGWEIFVWSGCLQWFSEKDRIVPNLAGGTQFANIWGDNLPAAANKASDLGHG